MAFPIRQRRQLLGYSLRVLAESSGVSLETMTSIEAAGSCRGFGLNIDQLSVMAKQLKCRIGDLDPTLVHRQEKIDAVVKKVNQEAERPAPPWRASRRPRPSFGRL